MHISSLTLFTLPPSNHLARIYWCALTQLERRGVLPCWDRIRGDDGSAGTSASVRIK